MLGGLFLLCCMIYVLCSVCLLKRNKKKLLGRDQPFLQEQLSEQNRDLREVHVESFHEMEELHAIPGNVFGNPTTSSPAPYSQGLNPCISDVSKHISPHM